MKLWLRGAANRAGGRLCRAVGKREHQSHEFDDDNKIVKKRKHNCKREDDNGESQPSDDHPCRQRNTKTVPKKKFSLHEIESSADDSVGSSADGSDGPSDLMDLMIHQNHQLTVLIKVLSSPQLLTFFNFHFN